MPNPAQHSSSDVDHRPEPKDLSHHLSRTTKARGANLLKSLYKYTAIPGIGQFAGGLPNQYYFPFDSLDAKVSLPDRWQPTPNKPVDPPVTAESVRDSINLTTQAKLGHNPLGQPQDIISVPHNSSQPNPVKKIDLATALQYGTAQGYPPLYYFIREFTQKHFHPNCPYRGGPEVILTCGNSDGFSKALLAFSNEWNEEKDWIRDREAMLVEEFAYMSAVQAAKPRGLNIVPVAMDDEGMRADGPGGLEDVLANWNTQQGRRPHLLYTVTMGQNPTSGVLSLQRRREIYALCSKYDILIIEDDPYWYLQFPTATAHNTTTSADPTNMSFNHDMAMFANAEPRPMNWKSSGFTFLDSLVPSYLNVDTDGRVIRLDTFSKTVAPGCRLGWISTQPAFIERLLRITESTTQQPSGFVQAMIAELILGPSHDGLSDAVKKSTVKGGKGGSPDDQGWRAAGWVRWLEGLRGNYEKRMNTMCRILDAGSHLIKTGRRHSMVDSFEQPDEVDEWSVVEKSQLLSFDWPVGGMFLWLHVHFENHPLYTHYKSASADGPSRLSKALWLFWTTLPYRVIVAPGSAFSPTEEIEKEKGWQFFRLCFAAVDEDLLEPVSHRLVEGITDFWKIKDAKIIDKLLADDEADGQDMSGMEQLVYMAGPC